MHVAFIPARHGSKRLPGKNTRLLFGVPLLAYSIVSALESSIYDEIVVSTDNQHTANIAMDYGAKAPILRPPELAMDNSADYDWLMHALENMISLPKEEIKYVSILRPTSPLRSSQTIKNAFVALQKNQWADSLRAMEKTTKHPGKMWTLDGKSEATPYLNQTSRKMLTYNVPTQTLEEVWVQNASLEIAKLDSILSSKSISGARVMGYEMPGFEGFDINTPEDWDFLECIISSNSHILSEFKKKIQ